MIRSVLFCLFTIGFIAFPVSAVNAISENPGYFDHSAWRRSAEMRAKTYGKIVLIGGIVSKESLESYHPSKPSLNKVLAATLSTPRDGHVSAVLADKTVLIAGGTDDGGTILAATGIFSPSTGSTTPVQPMSVPRFGAGAAPTNGDIMVCGGNKDGANYVSSCEKYVCLSQTWTSIASMSVARSGLAMVEFRGAVLAIGGYGAERLSVVESYDVRNDTWTTKEALPAARSVHAAASFQDILYVCGGKTSSGTTNRCLKYDGSRWREIEGMQAQREMFNLVPLDGYLFALGSSDVATGKIVEKYDPQTKKWALVKKNLIHRRIFSTAVVFPQ